MYPRIVPLFLLLGLLVSLLPAQQGCTGASPVASFKLYVKPPEFAPYPLREVNELLPGMKIQYQPVHITGSDPKDARIALILAESIRGSESQRLLILEPQRADQIAEWELPFRTEIVALVFGPQGLSESKVGNLIKKDASLVKELANYAEQTQRVEDLINVLEEAERSPRPGESLDAALTGFSTRHGMSMTPLDRQASTSDQALALMRTLNPTLSTYDPLAPSPNQRLQQSAGLAASVAGLFWGSQVVLYAGGAGLFLNMRSLLFPGSEFRSALLQGNDEQRLTLCTKATQHKSRTRLAYLWATRVPDTPPPGVTLSERIHTGAGLDAALPVMLAESAEWRNVSRAQEWRLQSVDGAVEHPLTVTADSSSRTLRFRVPEHTGPGLYKLAARWDWLLLKPNGYFHVHTVQSGNGPSLSGRSYRSLLDGAKDVEIAVEGGDFRFVEQATLKRKGDPYSTPRAVPFRLVDQPESESKGLFVLLNGPALERGTWQLALKQTGGKELQVEVPVLPQPPVVGNLPLRLNLGGESVTVSLEGQRLELVTSVEAEGVRFTPAAPSAASPAQPLTSLLFSAEVDSALPAGTKLDLKLKLRDRTDPVVLPGAIEILGPLPALLSSQIAHRENNGVALREQELSAGGLVTTVLAARHAGSNGTLQIACKDGVMQAEALALRPGQTSRDARLQMSSPESFHLTFDPGRVGQHGCLVEARLQTETGTSTPLLLGRVVRLPKLEGLTLSDELLGEDLFGATLIGQDLEAIAAVGWESARRIPVTAIPRPREGDSRKQELRIALPWPSPTPRAPVMIWLHDESEGRLTSTRTGM